MRIASLFLVLLLQAATGPAQSDAPAFDQLAGYFDYPRSSPLDFQQRGVEKRGNALVIDLE